MRPRRRRAVASPVRAAGGPAAAALVIGLLATLLLSALGPADPAGAHARLIGSDPAADAVVDVAPDRIRLRYDEAVEPVPGAVRVLAPDGTDVATGAPSVGAAGTSIDQEVQIGDRRGTFTVTARVLSADGHVVGATFVFSVGERSEAAAVSSGGDVVPRVLDVVGRWVAASGALLALGVVLLAALDTSAPLGVGLVGRRRVLLAASAALLTGTVLTLLGVAAAFAGSIGAAPAAVPEVVSASDSGLVVALRVGVAVAVLVLVAIPSVLDRVGPGVALLVIGALVLPSFGGHAATAASPAAASVAGSVHLLAAGLWVGTLGVLAVRWHHDRPLLGEFSKVAVVAAPLVVLSGLVGAWWQLGTPAAAWSSTYGRLLIAKAAFAGVLVLLGWANRRQLADATRRTIDLAASVRLEAVFGLVVVGLSAVLVVTPPPSAPASVAPITVQGRVGALVVDLTVSPAAAGPNRLDLLFSDPAGEPLAVDAVDVRASTDGVEARRLDVESLGPAVARAEDVVLTPGPWRFRVTVVRRGVPERTELEVQIS